MKKIIFLLSLFAILVTSCKDNEYLVYDSESVNHVSFTTDTVEFSYGFYEDYENEIELDLTIFGMPVMTEGGSMEINISYGDETTATEGVEFDIVKTITQDNVNQILIDIHKDALVYGAQNIVVLDIVEGDDFSPTGTTRCYLRFSYSEIEQPLWWNVTKLGEYTVEKHTMFINLFWATEETSPTYYTVYIGRHDNNLDGIYLTESFTTLMLNYNTGYWQKYFYAPMYAYYLETGDPDYEVPEYYF